MALEHYGDYPEQPRRNAWQDCFSTRTGDADDKTPRKESREPRWNPGSQGGSPDATGTDYEVPTR